MINTIFNALDNPIVNSILLFLTVSALLYAFKPKFMFDEDGKMKTFGYGEGKTCFTFPVVVFGTTLIGYIIFKVLSSNKESVEKSQDGGRSRHRRHHSPYSKRSHGRHSHSRHSHGNSYSPKYHFGSESPYYERY
jgi:hypothetical protein